MDAGGLDGHLIAAGGTYPSGSNRSGTHADIGEGGTCARLGTVDYDTVEQYALTEARMSHEGDLISGGGIGQHDGVDLPSGDTIVP